ncbi:MAG: hypothetical protein HQL01_04660 [Nitrospirae bacterium]|nr:hypothetical protein [Nitrospirota bacterium]
MPTTLPIEIYDLLERQVGKEDARDVGRILTASLDTIEIKANALVEQKKAEIKDELTKELATKEELAKLEGRLNEKIAAVKEELAKLEGRLNDKVTAVEGRLNEKIAAVKEELAKLEGRLSEKLTAMDWKMKVYFLILTFVVLLTNPKALDLIARLFGLVK